MNLDYTLSAIAPLELADLKLMSSAFVPGSPIPLIYTAEGEDISPPLAWRSVPHGTKTLALVLDDPDAPDGLRTHWLLYNIPFGCFGFAANVCDEMLPDDVYQGMNDFGHSCYDGPVWYQDDEPHQYYFRLFALDMRLEIGPGATRDVLFAAMDDHILASAELMARCGR